ncbi:MAG: lysophospholipid acyltransferase family protein [Planctomycetota bacterium]
MKITPQRARWISRIGAPVVRAVGTTWRIRVFGHQVDFSRADMVFAFLHGDMLVPAVLYRDIPAAILISKHGDGELIAQVLQRLGRHRAVRGSSSRGGARAVLELVRDQVHLPWGITPDGPRGPRGHVHEGAIQLAAESKRPLIAAGYAVSRGKRLSSWDRFVIPYPFARIAAWVDEPLLVPENVGSEQRRVLAAELKDRLNLAHERATRALRDW